MEYKFKNKVVINKPVKTEAEKVANTISTNVTTPEKTEGTEKVNSSQENEIKTNRTVMVNEKTGEFIIPFNQRRLFINL